MPSIREICMSVQLELVAHFLFVGAQVLSLWPLKKMYFVCCLVSFEVFTSKYRTFVTRLLEYQG